MSNQDKQTYFSKFDKRLLEINLKSGLLTETEYQKHLSELRDDTDRAEKLDLNAASDNDFPVKSPVNGQAGTAEPTPARTNNDPFGSGY